MKSQAHVKLYLRQIILTRTGLLLSSIKQKIKAGEALK
jgi:hypothetical protein